METVLIVKIAIYVAFFAALAFFSGSETAITSLSKHEMDSVGDGRFEYWMEKPEKVLSTILVGTNLAMVGAGVVAVSIAADIAAASPVLAWTIPAFTPALVLIFGEILPKIYSRYHAFPVGKNSVGVIVRLSETFNFVNMFLINISEAIIGNAKTSEPSFKSSREIKHFLESGNLPVTRDTRTLLKNIIDFRSRRVKDVMIPRREITSVDLDRSRDEIFDKIIKSGYSRLPAYRSSPENIVGIIYAKDIAFSYRNKDLIVIDDILRPAYFFPENLPVEKLLKKFRDGHFHMAIAVDEHGLITGLVTIEDALEEIVGEVWDEHDIRESNVQRLPDGSCIFNGKESLSSVAAEFKIVLPAQEYSTVGGWVAGLFGEIPPSGVRINWGGLEMEVMDADVRRIKKIKISRAN